MKTLKTPFLQLLILTALLFNMACNPEDTFEAEPACNWCQINHPTHWFDKYDDPEKPDVVVKGNLHLKSSLTVNPGVLVVFKEGASITGDCNGSITAVGTEDKHITFRGEEPVEGFWQGIEIASSSEKNKFDYCDFLHTGKYREEGTAAIRMSGYGGIYFSQSCSSRLRITNCTIKEASGYGIITLRNRLDSFYNNHISVSGKAAILMNSIDLKRIDTISTLEANEGVGIEFYDLSVHGDLELKKLKGNPPYLISGGLSFKGYDPLDEEIPPIGLIISKGVEIRFSDNASLRIYDHGYISAIGTADEPIIFTGADSSGPQWNGIHISSDDVRNKLEHCVIKYGGANIFEYKGFLLTIEDSIQTNIFIGKPYTFDGPPSLTLNNCTIEGSGGCGIQVQEGAILTESNNTFVNNQGGDICE